jgi:hypothetical protein
MADLKISALTASTTPLTGTEVLPIVQSGTTKQVSVANLTAGRAPSMSGATLRNTAPVLNFVTTAGEDITGYISNAIDVGSGGKLIFGTKRNGDTALDRVSINAAGDMTLLTSNLVVGTSGKGIDFSATSGTGTSELLNDYEEGDWTPVVVGSSTPGTGTYTTQVGRYTKIGNRVFFNLNLNWSAHTGSGDMSISGLPFTSNSTSNNASSLSSWVNNLTLSALNILTPIVNTNSASVSFFQTPVGGGAVGLVTLDTSAQVIISGHYEV